MRTSFLAPEQIGERPAAWKVRSIYRQPTYQEVILQPTSDDCFLVPRGKMSAVDRPGSTPRRLSALVDNTSRLSPSIGDGDAVCVPFTCLSISDLD